jgi:four helix bundle protein
MIYDVNDLEVYRISLQLLENLYTFLRKVPISEMDTTRNCKRAGKSIPTNLTEGFAKRTHEAIFKHHLLIAIGSSDEVIAHLRTIGITVPRLINEAEKLSDEYRILSKKLNTLHKIWHSYNPGS